MLCFLEKRAMSSYQTPHHLDGGSVVREIEEIGKLVKAEI